MEHQRRRDGRLRQSRLAGFHRALGGACGRRAGGSTPSIPTKRPWSQATRSAAIAAGRPYELDVRLRQADGTYRWVLRRAVPLRDESGRIVQWYGAGTDIDALKRAEAALRESEAFLAEAQRLSRTGSFGWDLSRAELRWSEETFRIFEYDPKGEAPTVEHVVRRTHPDDLDTVRQAIDRVTHDKADWDLDHRLLMPDGRVKYVHVVARAARHAGGVEFVGAVMDVTATTARAAVGPPGPGARPGGPLHRRPRGAHPPRPGDPRHPAPGLHRRRPAAHRGGPPHARCPHCGRAGRRGRPGAADPGRGPPGDVGSSDIRWSTGGSLADAVRETADQALRGTDSPSASSWR